MSGLKEMCKRYGSVEVVESNGKKVIWVWDFANDTLRLKSEMSKEEIAASEKAKWQQIKALISELNIKAKI